MRCLKAVRSEVFKDSEVLVTLVLTPNTLLFF
jgi:hypothetical protein